MMIEDGRVDLADATIDELRHRIKNLVQVVKVLVSHSLRSAASPCEAAQTIEPRLDAIGGAVDTLVRSDWSSIELADLIELALAHRRAFAGRFRIEGPAVQVRAEWAVALVLALHELETNAIKYGSLSGEKGTVMQELSQTLRRVLASRRAGVPDLLAP